MKKILFGLAIFLIATNFTFAEEKLSYGVGLGPMYGGLGLNIALKDNTNLKYLSTGFWGGIGYSSVDGTKSFGTLGIGIGWIKTDILSQKSNKHGIGLHLGTVSGDHNYGLGVNCTYFLNGIKEKG